MTTGAGQATIQNHLQTIRTTIDTHMAGLIRKAAPAYLYQPIHYALCLRGKRLRPALLMLACDSHNGDMRRCLQPAVAIELLHSFTLVHDDIMDHDDFRRGQPTLHAKWDEGVALLAGDGLISLAYLELLNTQNPDLLRICTLFSQAILTVCEGQALDKEFEEKHNVPLRSYTSMIEKKTAALMAVSAEIGARMADVPEAAVAALRNFGHDLGMAFQIQDDLLDLVSDVDTLGKDIGSDLEQGKKTYPLLMLQERAGKQDRAELRTLAGSGHVNMRTIKRVVAMLEDYGVLQDTAKTVDRWIRKAVKHLESPAGPPRPDLLKDLAVLVQNRAS